MRSLIRWAGEDSGREGLRDTPNRVARAWCHLVAGHEKDPHAPLATTFEDAGGCATWC
ncbi:GTP cyclohydrolase I [Hydrogenophaga sp. XSHU_21]